MLKSYKEFAIARGLVEDASASGVSIADIIGHLEQMKVELGKQIDREFSIVQAQLTGHVRLSMRNNQGVWNKLKNWWQVTWHGKDRDAIEHAGSDNLRIELPGLLSLYEHEILSELMDIMEAGPINQALAQMTPMISNLSQKLKLAVYQSFDQMITRLRDIEAAGGTLSPGGPAPAPTPAPAPGGGGPAPGPAGGPTSGDLGADMASGSVDGARKRRGRRPAPAPAPGGGPAPTADPTASATPPADPAAAASPSNPAKPDEEPEGPTPDAAPPEAPKGPAPADATPHDEPEGEEDDQDAPSDEMGGDIGGHDTTGDEEDGDVDAGDEVEDNDANLAGIGQKPDGDDDIASLLASLNDIPSRSSAPRMPGSTPRQPVSANDDFEDQDELKRRSKGQQIADRQARKNSMDTKGVQNDIGLLSQKLDADLPDANPEIKKIAASMAKGGGGADKMKFYNFVSQLMHHNPEGAKVLQSPYVAELYKWLKGRVARPEDMASIGKGLDYDFVNYPDMKTFKADQQAVLANVAMMLRQFTTDPNALQMDDVKPRQAPKPKGSPTGSKAGATPPPGEQAAMEWMKQEYLRRLKEVSASTWKARTLAYDLSHLPLSEQVRHYKKKLKA